jgi:pyruvate formate lyase activating enzyme
MTKDSHMNRRNFIRDCSALGCASLLSSTSFLMFPREATAKNSQHKFEARWYEKIPHKKVKCNLCPRECVVDDHERGYCGVRENWDGIYYTLVHSNPCTYHIDPIEKKPLFHFLPGTTAFSVATVGCNVDCKFCQNWQISQIRPEQTENIDMSPRTMVRMTREAGAPSIAYTYTEPVVFAEYMYDTAAEGNKQGVKSVMISNGYIKEKPMRELAEVLAAVKIDLKAFSEKYYKDIIAGELQPVLDILVLLLKLDIWTEIVYLVVPTLNDGDKEFRDLSKWMKQYLGTDVPVHFTRFYPQYKLQNMPPTPVKTLERARDIATAEGMNYVYVGNVPGHSGEHTYCAKCNEILIKRRGFWILENKITDGKCPKCHHEVPGVWF